MSERGKLIDQLPPEAWIVVNQKNLHAHMPATIDPKGEWDGIGISQPTP